MPSTKPRAYDGESGLVHFVSFRHETRIWILGGMALVNISLGPTKQRGRSEGKGERLLRLTRFNEPPALIDLPNRGWSLDKRE